MHIDCIDTRTVESCHRTSSTAAGGRCRGRWGDGVERVCKCLMQVHGCASLAYRAPCSSSSAPQSSLRAGWYDSPATRIVVDARVGDHHDRYKPRLSSVCPLHRSSRCFRVVVVVVVVDHAALVVRVSWQSGSSHQSLMQGLMHVNDALRRSFFSKAGSQTWACLNRGALAVAIDVVGGSRTTVQPRQSGRVSTIRYLLPGKSGDVQRHALAIEDSEEHLVEDSCGPK